MDPAPDFTLGYPSGGKLIGPIWQAMWEHLADGAWRMARDLASEHPQANVKTVTNLLSEARRRDMLQRRWVRDQSRPSVRFCEYRRRP